MPLFSFGLFLSHFHRVIFVLNPNSPKQKGKIRKGVIGENEGTTGRNNVEISNDNSLSIGDIEYEKAECVHIPYSPDYLDGVFALNGLSAFNIEINYDDNKIYCYSKDETIQVDSSMVELSFRYNYGVPYMQLPIKLGGVIYELWLEVDTGSDRTIDLNTPFVEKNRLLERLKPFKKSFVKSSDGDKGELSMAYFDEVVVGKYIMPNVVGGLSSVKFGMLSKEDVDGMIGNNFLKHFNMLIDFQNYKIYLKPNKSYFSSFPNFLVK